MKKWLVFLAPFLAVTFSLSENPENRPAQAAPPHATQAHHFDRSVAAIRRVHLKPTTKYWRFDNLALDRAKAEEQLRQWRDQGIDAIEIFAPAEGGNSYGGLDAIDRYRLDPGVGSMADFRWMVSRAHELGVTVIAFDNLGYSSIYATQFLKACQDVRAGRESREAKMFFWSSVADAPPPPVKSNSYFFVRPNLANYDAAKTEFWQWDERCQHYYWTRWPGKDKDGNTIHLPQYNWLDEAWPEEAESVVRFWMDTGLDGMVIDAVNWYVGYTWEKGTRRITGPIAGYGKTFSQPEGAGAFHTDDPVGWAAEGHWTNIYDYGLGIWWEKGNNPLKESVEKGDPRILEAALRNYHDRVLAAGSSLYAPVPQMQNDDQQEFVEALLATSGDVVCYCGSTDQNRGPARGVAPLLKLRASHPALYLDSTRRQIPTQDDSKYYSILRSSADKAERIVVVFNFQPTPQTVSVDVGAIDGRLFADLSTSERVGTSTGWLSVSLPGYGYRLYSVR
ncbi:MAG TPA: alpha-amylase family glycosyl hydrolase [Terriglobales bacterium]|nr:alpha-amylase family glycosyl hydrolase [Terriglobales bacterium]